MCLLSGTLGFLQAYVENPSIFDDFDENGNPVKHVNSSLPTTPTHSQQAVNDDEAEQQTRNVSVTNKVNSE